MTCLCFDFLIGKKLIFKSFELKVCVVVKTKALSNRGIKEVLFTFTIILKIVN